MTEEEIKKICKKYNIKKYVINEDMSIDVHDDVQFWKKSLNDIPLKFGKVFGYFDCGYNELTSLKNSPHYVSDYFTCDSNNISTLDHCPKYVGGYFGCKLNNFISIKNGPEFVGSFMAFSCSSINKRTRINIADTLHQIYANGSVIWKF